MGAHGQQPTEGRVIASTPKPPPGASVFPHAAILESAPDAVIGVDATGTITYVNRQVQTVFGYVPEELVGLPVETLLPERFHVAHRRHRGDYFGHPVTRPMGAELQLAGRRKDGSEFPVDISLSAVETPDGLLVTAFARDVSDRRRAEEDAQRLREAQIRRRQALEINDVVVQGLVTAVYSLERGDTDYAAHALGATLEAARLMMDGLLHGSVDLRQPMTLVRDRPATVLATAGAHEPASADETEAAGITVVIADDTPDMRMVLRLALSDEEGFSVVGEAGDGAEAVDLASRHQPDVVVLDLAMPVMDGLTAIPLIRAASPASKVVVLSGYGSEEMLEAALEAGADAYVVKGRPMESLGRLLRDLCPAKGTRRPQPEAPLREPDTNDEQERARHAAQDLALSITSHELATPVTVLQGMLQTLRDRMDVLPSSVVRELIDSMLRHADQMGNVLAVLNEARRVSADAVQVEREPVDLVTLVRNTVNDVAPALGRRSISIEAPASVVVSGDPVRLRAVLTNLLTNAAKFSPATAGIDVGVAAQGALARVWVTDQGPGIPVDRQPQLFMKFSRLGATAPGMGLGLFIARGIAHSHGGDLRLTRSDDRGSTFTLELPTLSAVTTTGSGSHRPVTQPRHEG